MVVMRDGRPDVVSVESEDGESENVERCGKGGKKRDSEEDFGSLGEEESGN